MSATNPSCPGFPRRHSQRGAAAVEFALVGILFFALVFSIIELARAMYIFNTLQEVTRRAAALATNVDFSDASAVQGVRERAIFRNGPGFLMFADPVTDQHINIDYMRIRRDGATLTMERILDGALPASPAQNHENCTRDPYDASCIRLVRVRVCQEVSGAACTPLPYQTLTSFIQLPLNLPRSTTISHAETLGMP